MNIDSVWKMIGDKDQIVSSCGGYCITKYLASKYDKNYASYKDGYILVLGFSSGDDGGASILDSCDLYMIQDINFIVN
jgi:hypothetical protein